MGPCVAGPMHCDSERLAFCGRRPITRLAGAGSTWVVNFFSLYFSVLGVFFNVGACTALIRVLYCMCTHSVLHVQFSFFVSVFLLLCNLFFQCMGVHCLVNHTRNALIMVLYCTFIYFCTALIIYVFAFFFLCFCSYVFFFQI